MQNLSIPLYRMQGEPVLAAELLPGRVRLNIHDSADPGNSEDVGFTCGAVHAARLLRAVEAFNNAFSEDHSTIAAE